MQDRVSTYPNRWKLTPVTGQTNVYDFERADGATIDGTPLNKATFLPDNVANALEQVTGALVTLPSEALNAIATLLNNLDVSKVAHVEYGSYVGTGGSGTDSPNILTFTHKPRFLWVINAADWTVTDWAKATRSALWYYPVLGQQAYSSEDGVTAYVYYSMPNDTTLSWYYYRNVGQSDTKAREQKNIRNATYYYVALTVE